MAAGQRAVDLLPRKPIRLLTALTSPISLVIERAGTPRPPGTLQGARRAHSPRRDRKSPAHRMVEEIADEDEIVLLLFISGQFLLYVCRLSGADKVLKALIPGPVQEEQLRGDLMHMTPTRFSAGQLYKRILIYERYFTVDVRRARDSCPLV
jgi:hypothetical protein